MAGHRIMSLGLVAAMVASSSALHFAETTGGRDVGGAVEGDFRRRIGHGGEAAKTEMLNGQRGGGLSRLRGGGIPGVQVIPILRLRISVLPFHPCILRSSVRTLAILCDLTFALASSVRRTLDRFFKRGFALHPKECPPA